MQKICSAVVSLLVPRTLAVYTIKVSALQAARVAFVGIERGKRSSLACFSWRNREHASQVAYSMFQAASAFLLLRFTADKKKWPQQYEKPILFRAPGTTFSGISDEVRPERRTRKGPVVSAHSRKVDQGHSRESAPRSSYLPFQCLAS